MSIETDTIHEIPVIRPKGPLDRRAAVMVRYALNALALRGVGMAAVDLSEAETADEDGVELLAELSRRVVAEGWRWMVISLGEAGVAVGQSFRLDQAQGRAFALVAANDSAEHPTAAAIDG